MYLLFVPRLWDTGTKYSVPAIPIITKVEASKVRKKAIDSACAFTSISVSLCIHLVCHRQVVHAVEWSRL